MEKNNNMAKHKESYIGTYKRIIIQLLLSIFLFANCERLDINPDSVDSQPAQEEVQDETIVFDEQAQTGFSNLPLELLTFILSFLDQKNFHRASLVCHAWRDAALMAGSEKMLDLSKRKLDERDCQVLLQIPFSSLILKECQLGDQGVLILSRSTRIKHLNLFNNKIEAAGTQALASGNMAALTSLILYYNRIGDEGAEALRAWAEKKFIKLDL